MVDPEEPNGNRLLAALADVGGPAWLRHLEQADLKLGQVLQEPGRPLRHVYLPTSAVVSLLYVMQSGATAEVALVGNEGIDDTSIFLGGATTARHAWVLVAGRGFRVGAETIKDEFDRPDAVRHLLLRYTQALATQIAQTAVCNRHHAIDQQLCGWLLHSLDRLPGSADIMVTQELIASMLGVRRETVTQVAGQLQAAGLIRYARGHISVLGPAGLERRSCECHAVVKKEYDRLLPRESARRPANRAGRAWPRSDDAAPGRLTPLHEASATCEA